ncbi:hypothetical protein ACXR2T_03970 [Leucobacter sp. HY1910]
MSKSESLKFTPDGLRMLMKQRPARKTSAENAKFQAHDIASRLGKEKVSGILQRYNAGESARALALEYEVATSALTRLLRENSVVVRRKVVTPEIKAILAREYEAGATVAELEDQHQLSHGSVLRALHGAGVEMRAKAPRSKYLD